MLRSMPHVLVVDDDPVILRLLEVNFRLEGFDVSMATRGEEAIALAASGSPDVVVLDVMLPGMDGHQVYRGLRENPETSRIPVIFLSARAMDEDIARYATEDVDYVTKPFDPSELVDAVRRRIASQ